MEDPHLPDQAERLVLLGLSGVLCLLVVVHALRDEDVFRIISARKATRLETQDYQSRLGSGIMRAEYDFSKAKRNPYAKRLKRRVTIRLDGPTVDYFKGLAKETGIP